MEHIIQFGVTVDDEAIKKEIIKQAANTVTTEIKRELGIDNYYSDKIIKRMVNNEVTELFNTHKDAIIAEAGKQLAEKLARTKAVKEKILQEEK